MKPFKVGDVVKRKVNYETSDVRNVFKGDIGVVVGYDEDINYANHNHGIIVTFFKGVTCTNRDENLELVEGT